MDMVKFILSLFILWLLVSPTISNHGWAGEFEYISPVELKKLIEVGDRKILIVDTQPKSVYDLDHIKGAINFPWSLDLKHHGNLPMDKTLILYCNCVHEEDSTDVAKQLREKWDYLNLKILKGGWSQWQKLGYPTEKGNP